MGLLSFAAAGNYSRFYNDLKALSKTNGKNPMIMFIDTAISTVLFGSGLQDYLNYKFYEKSFKERSTYVTIGNIDKANQIIANIKYSPFISNKINFHHNYHEFVKRDFLPYDCSYEEFEAFTNKHSEFVLKPKLGLGGHSVIKIKINEITDLKEFHSRMNTEELFVEELIIQHDDWAILSPNSVNTLRVMTEAVNGKSRIIFAGARIGSGKSIADNFHQGGMAVLIDLETGTFKGNGYDKKLNEYKKSHNGVKLDGYVIPYWNEIKEMVLKAALVNDKINLVGWDVAITKNGPEIIEGNRGPGWDLVQITLNKGTKYMVDEILEHVRKNSMD